MSDERGRKRDTPTGIGPAKPNAARAPRGAGLSGNLPAGSRYGANPPPGSTPIEVRNEPPRNQRPDAPRRHEPVPSGPWDATTTPPRNQLPDPSAHAEYAEYKRQQPRSRTAKPASRSAADAFAATRPAGLAAGTPGGRIDQPERPLPREHHERPAPREHFERPGPRAPAEPPERAVSMRPGASPRPPEPAPHKPSLRLKLDVDQQDVVNEGRVRVPKRRAPAVLGVLLILGALAGGALLWIDAHGGVDNFVAQLQRVINGEPPQAMVNPQPSAAATETPPAQAPAVPQEQPVAQAPVQQPAAAQPNTAVPAAAVKPEPQIATGEIEAPESEPQQPAAATPQQPQQPAAAPAAEPAKPAVAAPAPAKPKAAPRVVKKQPVRRDPVIRIEQLGEGNSSDRVLGAAPPDPSGQEVLPPPDPPAPE